jgi:hypothetical protein
MDDKDQVQGEGNYEATRNYRRRTEAFIESGRVEAAAQNAASASADEQQELERAEEVGRSHTAEEDPQLRRD